MNDESTSDALTRASAYLDGELDAPEIEAVEADPAVMAEVARLRALQATIRDIPGPSSYARDLAIDAALAEFDHIHQPVAGAIQIKPRPSYGRWMAVAAAIAGVAALGAVITATRGGGDDIDASSASATTNLAAALDANAADRQATGAGAPAVPQPEATQSQVLYATEAPATTAAAAAEASAESAAATSAAGAATAAPAATTPASGSDTFAQFDPNTPIPDDVELGRVGRQLLAEWQAGARESKVGTPCDTSVPGAVLLSDALLVVDGATHTVLIAADPETARAFALDPDSCVVLMTGR